MTNSPTMTRRWILLFCLLAALPIGCGSGADGELGGGLPNGGDVFDIPPPVPTPVPLPASEIADTEIYGTEFTSEPHASGLLGNPTVEPAIVHTHAVVVPGAYSLRLIFEETTLGEGSQIEMWAPGSDDVFCMTRAVAEQWVNTTAIFPGDTVLMRLRLAPGAQGGFILHGAFKGVIPDDQLIDPTLTTQCGAADDRVASTDARVARLNNGCTAWHVGNNNCFYAAGHCYSCLAPGFPSVIEFNVPASTAGGALNPSIMRDQYVMTPGTLRFRDLQQEIDGCISPRGSATPDDWGVARYGSNFLGEVPSQRQGPGFTLDLSSPIAALTVRVTGYGTDTGAMNQTQQTHTGPLISNAAFQTQYQVDTTGGNSGSPVIDTATGMAFAIHTRGGCQNPLAGSNGGADVAYGPIMTATAEVCAKAAPTVTCPANQIVNCNANNGSLQTYMFPTTDPDAELVFVEFFVDGTLQGSDAVAGAGNASFTYTYPAPAASTVYDVVARATNASGTQGSCAFTVTVNNAAPTILCPADITMECTGAGGATVTFAPTAADDCTVAPTVVCVPASGTVFPIATTNVTCTVTDNAGQSAMCSFDVTVQDTTPPDLTLSLNRTLIWSPRSGLIDVLVNAVATDVCGVPTRTLAIYSTEGVAADSAFLPATNQVRLRAERADASVGRIYLVVVRATDAAGLTTERCNAVIVPGQLTSQAINNLRIQAATDVGLCLGAAGAPPAGYNTLLGFTAYP